MVERRAAIANAYRGDVHAFALLDSSGLDIIHSVQALRSMCGRYDGAGIPGKLGG